MIASTSSLLGTPGLRGVGAFLQRTSRRLARRLGLALLALAGLAGLLGLAGCGGGGGASEPPPAPPPTLEIRTGLDGAAAGPFQVSFVFSGDVSGFSQSSFSVLRGSVAAGSFKQLSAREFTVTINPPANAMGLTVIRVNAGAFSAVGSLLTNTSAYEFSKAFDTLKPVTTEPTVGFSHVMQGAAGAPPALLTITFDVDVLPFTLDKLEIASAVPSAFTRVSAREYTVVLTPASGTSAIIVVSVPEGAVTAAGANGVPNSRTYSYGILYRAP